MRGREEELRDDGREEGSRYEGKGGGIKRGEEGRRDSERRREGLREERKGGGINRGEEGRRYLERRGSEEGLREEGRRD